MCHGVPLWSGCLFPPTGKGSLGSEPELCAAAWDAVGILWELKFPSVTALRPGKHQLRPECFCPGCLLSLGQRRRKGPRVEVVWSKIVVRKSAGRASLLAQQQCLVRKGSPGVTGKSAAKQSLFCDGHTAAGAGSWRPRAVGVVQGVPNKNCHREIPAPTGGGKADRALETGTKLIKSSRVSQERERPWAKRLTAG